MNPNFAMSCLRRIKFKMPEYAHIVLKAGTIEAHRIYLAKALDRFCKRHKITLLITVGEQDSDEIKVERPQMEPAKEGQ